MNIDLERTGLLSRLLEFYKEDVTALPYYQPVGPATEAEY